MRVLLIAIVLLHTYACNRKLYTPVATKTGTEITTEEGNKILLGKHNSSVFLQTPYNNWYLPNYNRYAPDTILLKKLAPQLAGKRFEIFLGSWCGDSQREVPRMLKVLQAAGIKESQLQIVFVDNRSGAYKKSPGNEQLYKNIHRVPDLIVYNQKTEIGRIIESPVQTIEKDLQQILKQNYTPNYSGAQQLIHFLEKEKPVNSNDWVAVNYPQYKNLVSYQGELVSIGRIWMGELQYEKAAIAFKLTTCLYPLYSPAYYYLAELSAMQHDKEAAVAYCNKVLQLEPGHQQATNLLAGLKK
jgi:tetratricopeptide (TPR) repeat protein